MDIPMSDARRNSFNSWYERKGEEYNAQRRKRYQDNPELRAKARQQAAIYRQTIRNEDHGPYGMRDDFYTTTGVADILGISNQTLRNWESKHLIPKATYGDKHRLYSQDQVDLLVTMVNASGDSDNFNHARRILFSQWDK